MCGDHIYPWNWRVYRYGLFGIPVEFIPIVRSKRLLINFWMMSVKEKFSLWLDLSHCLGRLISYWVLSAINKMLAPIIRLAFTPFNNDASLFIKAFLDCLIKQRDPCLVIIILGFNIGNPGDICP